MKITSVKINNSALENVSDFLCREHHFEYKKQDDKLVVLASEQYYFRTNSTQLNMVVATQENEDVIIDLIGGAGSAGLLNIDFGSERNFIKMARKLLAKMCEEMNLEMKEVQSVVK